MLGHTRRTKLEISSGNYRERRAYKLTDLRSQRTTDLTLDYLFVHANMKYLHRKQVCVRRESPPQFRNGVTRERRWVLSSYLRVWASLPSSIVPSTSRSFFDLIIFLFIKIRKGSSHLVLRLSSTKNTQAFLTKVSSGGTTKKKLCYWFHVSTWAR